MARSIAQHHTDWLSLIETSGPFLTLPVLKRALPQGLEPTPPEHAKQVRISYEAWLADPDLHGQWVRWVLGEVLELAPMLVEGPAIPPTLAHSLPEHEVTLRPDLVVLDPPGQEARQPRLLIQIHPDGLPLDRKPRDERWAAAPRDRMGELLRGCEVRLGVVTNGETWTLVHAPRGAPTTFATWEAGVWLEERLTLDAFRTLLHAQRFFAVAQEDTLEALLTESADAEHEVTDQLGYQVRQAVELLVDAFSRADREAGGRLLEGVSPDHIYLAALTVMMRLVFLLTAEERGLFLLGDPLYDTSYAVSTLRAQLREQADHHGEEPLERRSTAWHRLLATFRMVHAGVEHENLRLPAYGGSLFDPDRFPFLEGRGAEHSWMAVPGRPLPVDDRTVLHILNALQVLRFASRGASEARRLSFRALDVEQIGHVYEGLLDHTAVEVTAPAVALQGKNEPEIALETIEQYASGDRAGFVSWVMELTGLTRRQVERGLDAEPDPQRRALLLAACDNDEALAARFEPYLALVRDDLRGVPKVFLAGSVYVTQTSERRRTGTYYTPRSLAEEIVTHALEPLVYHSGPAEGADRAAWQLRPAAELLDLRVCDMAMGSGAFLVGACRYLADRLQEAWETAEAVLGVAIIVSGEPAGDAAGEVVPADPGDRELLARRVVADRCLFGVDVNAMAVEMAKLSMWLITLAKDRPFSFLDHALRCGDSLLGVTDLAQIEHLHIDPARGRQLHRQLQFGVDQRWRDAIKLAIEKRRQLESFTVITVRDAEEKARLHREADEALNALRVVGDVIVGAALSSVKEGDVLDGRMRDVAKDVAAALDPDIDDDERTMRLQDLRYQALYWLDTNRPPLAPDRRTFHWPLEFPEVFLDRHRPGFDAIVGNPPFLGGKRISGPLGSVYREYLVEHVASGATGSADLVAYFFLRAAGLMAECGDIGLLATNTIAQGDTREVGLDRFVAAGWNIYRAVKSRSWPGSASLEIAEVWLRNGAWRSQAVLDDKPVPDITSALDVRSRVSGPAHRLVATANQSFQGSVVVGIGFVLEPKEAAELIAHDPRNRDVLFPYLNGEDLNSSPTQSPSRWIINFRDWPLERAEQYPEAMAAIRERVKPQRDRVNREAHRRYWWHYGDKRPALYATIDDLDRVLAIALVSNTVAPAFVPTGLVYAHKLAVFPYDHDAHFGLLTSHIHRWWAITRGSTLGAGTNYSPSDCFETFPQPDLMDDVAAAGKALDEHRRVVMLDRWEGLTATYNRVNDPDEHASDIAELRRLHVELDHAVAAAYGWNDLALDHDFRDTRQGLRYTLGPAARTEILDRLLELNHTRHAQELAMGVKPSRPARKASQYPRHEAQTTLEVD